MPRSTSELITLLLTVTVCVAILAPFLTICTVAIIHREVITPSKFGDHAEALISLIIGIISGAVAARNTDKDERRPK